MPWDLAQYNKQERNYLLIGIILVGFGIIGLTEITDKYGYKTTVTDKDGNVTIETIYTNPYHSESINTDSTGKLP